MTSDGVSTRDWRRVRALATRIANAPDDSDQESRLVGAMCVLIDSLTERYGERPSLLATKADYLEAAPERLRLLLRAYRLAEQRGDEPNLTLISSSIAQLLCIEELADFRKGRAWIGRLQKHMSAWGDESEAKELDRLRRILRRKDPRSNET